MDIFSAPPNGPYVLGEVELDGLVYFFGFNYGFRHDRWTLNILDELGDTIAAGIKLVAGDNLLASFTDERLPPGELRLDQPKGDDATTIETLGITSFLVYYDAAEVAQLNELDALAKPEVEIIIT